MGKEKAIEAVARASGGRALVPPRRATSLRLCNLWDERLHTEEDAADVRYNPNPNPTPTPNPNPNTEEEAADVR